MTTNQRLARALLRTRGTRVVEAADGSAEIIGAAHGYVWMRADVWAAFKAQSNPQQETDHAPGHS